MNLSWANKNFLILVPLVAIILAAIAGCQGSPVDTVKEQPEETYHVGVVSFGGGQREVIIGMQEGMQALGYQEGENIVYTIIDAKGDEQVKAAAEEFLRQGVDAVYSASTPVTMLVSRSIKDIPIVFNIVSDPVGVGLANSLTASGTNLTGCSNVVGQTGPKRLEVLRTILPDLETVVVLYDPKNNFSQDAIVILREAEKTLGVTLVEKHVGSKDDVVTVMKGIAPGEYDAFFHLGEAKVSGMAAEVIEAANNIKLPTMAHGEGFVQKGMLAAHGPSWRLLGSQCSGTLDKVLRGVDPGAIPIQIPLKFEFIVNLTTAKALGIDLPDEILIRADKLIGE